MNRTGLLLVVAMGATSVALAGHVFGTIRENNQPIRGAGVTLRCGAETVPGNTDQEGTYRIFARTSGACTLEINHNGRRAVGPLYSYDRPTAYDFDLVKDGKGGYELRKR